jgi:hypothetical protein
MLTRRVLPSLAPILALVLFAGTAPAQARITTPMQQFGFNFGDDYRLANYRQLSEYWHKLAAESDRMVLRDIGRTAEGRTMLAAIVTSPENHRRLDEFRSIAARMARAEGVTEAEARRLAQEGKAVVWIDGGLHATEVLGAQQLGEMIYQMVSRTDDETMRILRDVVIVFVHANPDGNDLVADWYMRNPVPEQRRPGGEPRLYQKYIGHDNNRDFFASTQAETKAMNRLMYTEWYPQIVYNHHQTGPDGTVMFAPPFRDPFNFNLDPLVILGIDQVGSAMHSRFVVEGKPGTTMRSGASYSTWWNGGLRTTAYFHNMIGILTETIGHATPITIPFRPQLQIPRNDYPFPIEPQRWHFRQSVEYSITANRAILDYASRNKEHLLFNIWRMGANSIERGNRDTWTVSPSRVAEVSGAAGGGMAALRQPEDRDARAYILPASQRDFPTVTKFVNALLDNGVAVHRATAAFAAGGKSYPAGSYVVQAAQAFRPHILDMFEPQDHPNDFAYPGAPPTRPYDVAGWTLAYQMGVEFDRILEGVQGPFERVTGFDIAPRPGSVATVPRTAGYVTSHAVNNAFIAVNRLLAAGEEVLWLRSPLTTGGRTHPAGALYVTAGTNTLAALQRMARETGVNFEAVTARPTGDALQLGKVRIGLWDQYGGSMPSGWTRWLMEQFEFPFEVVYPPMLDAGSLNDKYDVLVFVSGAIPGRAAGGGGGRGGGGGDAVDATLPPELQAMQGRVTAETTLPRIREFAEQGGVVIAIGSSALNLADHLNLPVSSHLVRGGEPIPSTEYFIPGSVLEVRVDTLHPLAHGMPERVNVSFSNSPVFRLHEDAAARGVRRVAWFDNATPLRSGWAWGQQHLDGGAAALEAQVGQGKVFLFGPEILFRAQPHGTFKFFFNSIYYGTAEGRSR